MNERRKGLRPTDTTLPDFTITFDPEFTPTEVREILEALADYYRKCGGLGLTIDFRLEEAEVLEPEYA